MVTSDDRVEELATCYVVTVDDFVSFPVCRRMVRETSAGVWIPSRVAVASHLRLRARSYANARSSSTLVVDRYSTWMEAALRKIERTLLLTFGIRKANLEPWQMTRYTRGESFDYHLDAGYWSRHPSGERRRTILIYLEEPIRGGATDFRGLHRRILPVAGRLVMWNNLLPTGNCNHAMIHAARPVWQGRKIILTTWERERRYVR